MNLLKNETKETSLIRICLNYILESEGESFEKALKDPLKNSLVSMVSPKEWDMQLSRLNHLKKYPRENPEQHEAAMDKCYETMARITSGHLYAMAFRALESLESIERRFVELSIGQNKNSVTFSEESYNEMFKAVERLEEILSRGGAGE